MAEKTKGDRLKETLRLLNELQRVGIRKTDSGYREIQRLMTAWVNDGVALSTMVELYRYGRQADLSLPSKADRAASINLRVVKAEDEDLSGSKDSSQ
jgi:hypothetical protein